MGSERDKEEMEVTIPEAAIFFLPVSPPITPTPRFGNEFWQWTANDEGSQNNHTRVALALPFLFHLHIHACKRPAQFLFVHALRKLVLLPFLCCACWWNGAWDMRYVCWRPMYNHYKQTCKHTAVLYHSFIYSTVHTCVDSFIPLSPLIHIFSLHSFMHSSPHFHHIDSTLYFFLSWCKTTRCCPVRYTHNSQRDTLFPCPFPSFNIMHAPLVFLEYVCI